MAFYRYGFSDLGQILANAVLYGLDNEQNIKMVAPDYVDISYMGQENRKILHLINFPVGKNVNSGWRRPGQNLVTVENIIVQIKLPRNRKLKRVMLAGDNSKLDYISNGEWVEVTVPKLIDHEIVVFELE